MHELLEPGASGDRVGDPVPVRISRYENLRKRDEPRATTGGLPYEAGCLLSGAPPVQIDRCCLDGRRCPAETVQDIVACATELAANAVLHSRSGLPGGHFSVEVACAGQSVRVTVEDSGGPWVERGTGGIDAECGRGLRIVAALSADMGMTGDAAGRTAWFCCRWGTGRDDQPAHVVSLGRNGHEAIDQ